MLATKLVVREISVPQTAPKNPLSVGSLPSQRAGAVHNNILITTLFLKSAADIPSPQSSSRKRGEAETMR
jgi:hypothetical protein